VRKRRLLGLAAVAAVVVVAVSLLRGGGATGSDEKAVRATLAGYGQASAQKDYATICKRYLAPRLLDRLRSIRLPCRSALARALGGVQSPTLTVKSIKLSGATALADVRGGAANQQPLDGTIELVKVAGAWRVQSFFTPAPTP
jgi:hypothetical protein